MYAYVCVLQAFSGLQRIAKEAQIEWNGVGPVPLVLDRLLMEQRKHPGPDRTHGGTGLGTTRAL